MLNQNLFKSRLELMPLRSSFPRMHTKSITTNSQKASFTCIQRHQASQLQQSSRKPTRCIKRCSSSPQQQQQDVVSTEPLVYDGVIFDMDGTLSVSCIDYQLMRSSIDVPVGDLFTVMETWTDSSRIAKSMDIILDIEATAAAQSSAMPGLIELLSFLQQCATTTKVGLVTRNTTQSVDAFFDAIGNEWRDVFHIMLTREHPHVKPDKRCLLYFADMWGVEPHKLLMVGDSTEDVECGNAAGTATCLIAGGGNEVGAAPTAPPRGAVPSFTVESLHELKERLEKKDTPLGWGAYNYSSSSSSDSDDGTMTANTRDTLAGAPPPGLDFIDWLFISQAIEGASCSFPRIDASRFNAPLVDDHPGSKVLHIQCGDGALSKLLFSAGVLVVGADIDNTAAIKRGLAAIAVDDVCVEGALSTAAEIVRSRVFDAAVLLCMTSEGGSNGVLEEQMMTRRGLEEVARVLGEKGVLCVEGSEEQVMKIIEQFSGSGSGDGVVLFTVEKKEEVVVGDGYGGDRRVRLMARKQ